MSEIVVIKSSNQVGVVRAVLINNETGEEIVEVQPVGRAHGFNRFVRRADVENGDKQDVKNAIANILTNSVKEIIESTRGLYGFGAFAVLNSVKELADSLRSGDV